MVEYLWDGEMDCGWEDLGEKVVDISSKFVDNLLNLMSFSYNEEAIKLITEESLGRFQNLAKKLAEEIQNGYYCQYEDMENVISTIRNEFIAIAKPEVIVSFVRSKLSAERELNTTWNLPVMILRCRKALKMMK